MSAELPEGNERHAGISTWWAVREVDHLFGRIGRYTRFVVYGKWSLTVIALLLTAVLLIWPLVTKDSSGIRVSFIDSKSAAQKPTSPVMDNPEYRDTGENGQQFKINGRTATQKTPTLVIIDQVEAQMLKNNGGWNSLTAARAEYDQVKKIIELYGNVTVVDDQTNTFTTEHATIEVTTSRIFGNNAILGDGPMGNIVASAFEITDNGKHFTFTRGQDPVKVKLDRAKKK